MKNIHTRLFGIIIVLLGLAIWAVVKYPTHEGLDIQGGMRVVLGAKQKVTNDQLSMVAEIMRQRVDKLGVSEPVVYPKPPDQIVLELPGLKNKEEALAMIQSTARLEFRYVPELGNGTWTTREETLPDGKRSNYELILDASTGKPVPPEVLEARVFSEPPFLAGDQLKNNARADISSGSPVVDFEFKDDKKSTFEDFTRTHINKPLAIFLDKKLISAPNINGVIPGQGIIEGKFTPEYARDLASLLNAGALPVPLEQREVRNVEATLGRQAVQQTELAGAIGLILVLVFMLGFYRLPGLLADIALVLYALFTFALFKLIPVTLTVPGIAGFILSIGMAVDANILIFERFKEERKTGKSLRAAIEAGFKRAFTAIFDSNVCTLITCGVLYYFGTGSVKGFAVTLALGVIVSMFTAITCSRTFLLLISGATWAQNDALYGLNMGFHPRLGVTKRMYFWFGLSLLVIVPGLLFWGMGGIKKSIEFTGGTEITADYATAPSVATINRALSGVGIKGERVLLASGENGHTIAYVTTPNLNPQQVDAARTAIQQTGGTWEGNATVSGAISRELTWNAIQAVAIASLLIILFLAVRFSIPSFVEGLKFGTCAVIALLHDVAVVWGSFAILGYFLNWQIDSLFVTAMLTVIGFSVHDTIVIFDRIRENLHHKARGETFAEVTDRSIEQTFARSINTTGTVVLTLVALLIFGGAVVKLFVTALLIGVISGTYSSIFNASPLLVLWKHLTGEPALVAAPAGGPAPRAATPRAAEPARPRVAPAGPAPVVDANGAAAGDGTDAAQRLKPKKRKQRRM